MAYVGGMSYVLKSSSITKKFCNELTCALEDVMISVSEDLNNVCTVRISDIDSDV